MALALLVCVEHAAARPGVQLRQVGIAGEFAVIGKAGDIVIDRAGIGEVGVAGSDQPADLLDHAVDVFRGARHLLRVFAGDLHAQQLRVFEKRFDEKLRHPVGIVGIVHVGRALLLGLLEALGGQFHLVLPPAVGPVVFGHVADVGDVHHLLDAKTDKLKKPTQQITQQKRAEIPDVGVVVNRRAAMVHAHHARRYRLENLHAVGQRVVEADVHHRRLYADRTEVTPIAGA